MTTIYPSSPQDGSACITLSRALRALLLVLSMTLVLGLQGCAALTVLALAEVLEAANESLRLQNESSAQTAVTSPEQRSVQSNQARPGVAVTAGKVSREPRYRTRLDKDTIEAGTPVRLHSTTSLESLSVQGMVLGVEETLVVFDPKGREIRRGSKKAMAGMGEGNFKNSFELLLPSGAPEGSYRLVTEAYLGSQLVGRDELKLKLTLPGRQRQKTQAL